MASDRVVDEVLVEWGERLFRGRRTGADDSNGPRSGISRGAAKESFPSSPSSRITAGGVRGAIRDTVRPGARQVMVKITGGGKGFKAMAAHARYISRQGKEAAGGRGQTLEVLDEQGVRHKGAAAIRQLMEDWRTSGSYIPEVSHRKEALHVIFSMPRDTVPEALHAAVQQSAERLFEGHRYAMVMHLDQGAPHVHVMVRAEGRDGRRLNPRKADLERWRATFARELQVRGIDAVATRRTARVNGRVSRALWEIKAAGEGRLRRAFTGNRPRAAGVRSRDEALEAWRQVAAALAGSPSEDDRRLAVEAVSYLAKEMGLRAHVLEVLRAKVAGFERHTRRDEARRGR